jgi:hypothetical protein
MSTRKGSSEPAREPGRREEGRWGAQKKLGDRSEHGAMKQGEPGWSKARLRTALCRELEGCAVGTGAARNPFCPVTNLNETLHSTGHGELFAVGWPGFLGHCVFWQSPAFLHHQFLGRETQGAEG